MRTRRGFTLAEVMVVGAILSMTSVMTLDFLRKESEQWELATAQADVNTGAEQGMDRLVRELRSATRRTGASPPDVEMVAPDLLRVYLPADADNNGTIVDALTGATEWDTATAIDYVYDAGSGQLQRLAGGAVQVLASNVSALQFDDQTTDASLGSNELKIHLTVQRTTAYNRVVSVELESIVRLVN